MLSDVGAKALAANTSAESHQQKKSKSPFFGVAGDLTE
jgi:hypothetical protein